MPDSKDLIQQVAQGIEASKTTSATPPGHSEASRKRVSEEHVDAINQVFALFRLNYHNQYFAAYQDNSQIQQVKKLWLESLSDYPVEQILRGAKHAIEHSEYLPTLNRMHECCQQSLTKYGLPTAHDAYLEACKAPSPKSAQNWSHPAVYLAGRDSDWFFLANNVERISWPVFRDHYQQYCGRVIRGENLDIPAPEAIEQQHSKVLAPEEQLAELHKLRDQTGL
ncbi:MAG: hypothetical protein IMF06_04090 [Proteobacteria bacterium]|nr:hypothetical protein [Pseudomonadota bacterium]